ncbi:MAG: flavin reductase family protein [Hoeflea sp.]|uniref:flavin reductase family protein n=1 Tax=Hoeflea sp. TaxID=1940281 RepID=UPI001D404D41|nr:flavin reductase family protein [Hoeflea sp.]MBU4530639.1 flavin reductase family protein [Alphaproteobacteria bacterium]MBU4544859.1 flavin reductase family protein [Alphaproteobacteria bacterium]MBU4552002.1 flavin reductase family protein [Alphaproteobacteria bacterium]MBV1722191.1 flavin reductase family protein [Hoeflea sp.]MBV1761753.1 flavin reductase family protein [Hoeflea sp.]
MFYETKDNAHGLPHDPFKAIVSPRPIGWIGTRGKGGSVNLAPYSYFNAISDHPKTVMFSSSGRKDSLRNAEETGEFTASMVSRVLAEKMNLTSIDAPYGESEFDIAELAMAEGRMVNAPFVAQAYAALECRVTNILEISSLAGLPSGSFVVIGQVMGIHLDEAALTDGMLDMAIAAPVARMGYMDYCEGSQPFQMRRPTWPKA